MAHRVHRAFGGPSADQRCTVAPYGRPFVQGVVAPTWSSTRPQGGPTEVKRDACGFKSSWRSGHGIAFMFQKTHAHKLGCRSVGQSSMYLTCTNATQLPSDTQPPGLTGATQGRRQPNSQLCYIVDTRVGDRHGGGRPKIRHCGISRNRLTLKSSHIPAASAVVAADWLRLDGGMET